MGLLICSFPMSCFITSYIPNEIQIPKDVESTFDCLLGNIKRYCKTRSIYRDICRVMYLGSTCLLQLLL